MAFEDEAAAKAKVRKLKDEDAVEYVAWPGVVGPTNGGKLPAPASLSVTALSTAELIRPSSVSSLQTTLSRSSRRSVLVQVNFNSSRPSIAVIWLVVCCMLEASIAARSALVGFAGITGGVGRLAPYVGIWALGGTGCATDCPGG